MTDTGAPVSYDSIRIDAFPFRIEGGVLGVQNLNSFQRKSVTGDYQYDSHPVLSSHIITDLSGGHGIASLAEGADAARYRFGVADVRKTRQFTLPPHVQEFTDFAGDAYMIGSINGTIYAAIGTDIYSFDETTDAWTDTTHNLTAVPVARAIRYKGDLYIPYGTGYNIYDGTGAPTDEPDYDAISFCYWDTKLVMLTSDGQIHTSSDGATWASAGDDGTVDEGYTPRSVVGFRDSQQQPMPVIVTDQGLFNYDGGGPSLYMSDVEFPPHPDFGLGADKWRGDLYIPVGMGMFRFTGSVQIPMGLDRDQGLPSQIRGKTVATLGDYNGLWALVSGAEISGDDTETWEFDSNDEDWYVSESAVVSSLHIWTGYGWHCYWTSQDTTGSPTWLVATTEDSEYRLWWTVGTTIYSIRQSFDFANARALIESGTGWFAEEGYIEFGGFDAGMVGYTKIGNSALLRVKNASATNTVRVSYRVLEEGTGWNLLGTVTSDGQHAFEMGDLDITGNIYKGVPFREIEFRLDWTREAGDAHISESPIVESFVFSYLKIIPAFHSFTAKLEMTEDFEGYSPAQQLAKIEELLAADRFYALEHRGEVYRVRLSGAGGFDFAGEHEDRSSRTINIIEIPGDL